MKHSLQDLGDDNNKNKMKSTEDLFTFLLLAFPLPAYLLWATLLFTTLLSMLPPNASEKRLDKTCLSSVFKKWAEKAADINIKLKIAIKLYVLVILF